MPSEIKLVGLFAVGWNIVAFDVVLQPVAKVCDQIIIDGGSTGLQFTKLGSGDGEQILVCFLVGFGEVVFGFFVLEVSDNEASQGFEGSSRACNV